MDNVTVTVKNDVITKLIDKLKNAMPFYQFLGARMKTESDQRFQQGIDPTGKPWPANSGLTKSLKNRPQVLIDGTYLMKSVKANATSKGLLFGTNKIYAPTHQYGMTIVAKKMLWIPLTKKAKTALKTKVFPEGLFKFTAKNGKQYVAKSFAQKIGGGYQGIGGKKKATTHRGMELWYALRKSMKMLARPFIGAPSKETVIESIKEWLK